MASSQHIVLTIDDKVIFDSMKDGKHSSHISNNSTNTKYTQPLFFQEDGHQVPIVGQKYTHKYFGSDDSKKKLGKFESFTFRIGDSGEQGDSSKYLYLTLKFEFKDFEDIDLFEEASKDTNIETLSDYFEQKYKIYKKKSNFSNKLFDFLKNIYNYNEKADSSLKSFHMRGGKSSLKNRNKSKSIKSKTNKNIKFIKKYKMNK